MPGDSISSQPEVSASGRPRTGLNYSIARTIDEAMEAWHLVYKAYRAEDLIDANPYEIHTTPQAVGPRTAIVTACLGPLPVATITGYADGPLGLPLDSVYQSELIALRQSGRKLIEVGLFADRREHLNRAAEGLFEFMRYAYFFGIAEKMDDIVIGVHPRHAPFYIRLLCFEKIGPIKTYPMVKDHAVVLLRRKLDEVPSQTPLPRGLAYFMENALDASVYAGRYLFEPATVAGSPLAGYLATRSQSRPAA